MPELFPEHLRAYVDALVPARAPELAAMEADARATDFPNNGTAATLTVRDGSAPLNPSRNRIWQRRYRRVFACARIE